jgi:hypothetical protein
VSKDRGDSWAVISPDLTTSANRDTIVTMGVKGSDIHLSRDDGVSQWPAIVSLAESPRVKGVYYTGSEDGLVYVSRNAGKTWQDITKNIPMFPAGAFVSEVVPSLYDNGTVFVTVDNHRLNDYAPYIWVSHDYGQTFRSIVNNLVGENVRTLTEDHRNRDVLYIGTETGIFLSLDRGKSWQRLKANLPNVRVDEITLHPRDNAMLVATHGRAIWVLDHLEPIQEYEGVEATGATAKLFTPGPALEWKTKDDRNEEFWGQQYFVGENPPNEAVVQYLVKKPVTDLKLRVSDENGKLVRDVTIPPNKMQPGIQTICWDMRVDSIAAPVADSAAAGRGGRGGGRGAATPAVPGVPQPVPTGYGAKNLCAANDSATTGRGGGGGGFGGGGGLGGPGPYVLPATYTVSLFSGGKPIDSKPLRVAFDPDVHFAVGEHEKYNTIVMDLHALQRRGVAIATALNGLYPQMTDVAKKVSDNSAVPAKTKAQFDSLNKDFESLRKRFGVPLPVPAAGGRGGGGGRGGPPPDPENVLARTTTLKNQLMSIWETPSAAMVGQYNDVKADLPKAIADANAWLGRAATVSQALKKSDITLTVPPVVK